MSDNVEFLDTVVIGGGQAGLATGYHLKKLGRNFVILDAHERVGDAWRKRWDSLVLFTLNRHNSLPGLKQDAPSHGFVTKDEMADYLETYATHFDLPVRTSTKVEHLTKAGDDFVITTSRGRMFAKNVIVAMSSYREPKVPDFADQLDPSIYQVHSQFYRNPDELNDGEVLIVGMGNSAADIGIELAKVRPTTIAGKPTAVIPFRIEKAIARFVLIKLVRLFGHRIFTKRTPLGRKLGPKYNAMGAPLIRVKPQDLLDAGVKSVGRISGVHEGLPVTDDGDVLNVRSVIWATGYRPAFNWIDLPIFGDNAEPEHHFGIVEDVPGLYFIGLKFLYSQTSETITGIGRDARRITKHLRANRPAGTPSKATAATARS